MDREGVLLLHGIGRTARSMRRPELALRDAGFSTFNSTYPSRRHDLVALAAHVAAESAAWRAGLDCVHLVTHSMGGLVARVLAARHLGPQLGRTVMFAPPNGGSELATRFRPWRLFHAIYGPAGAQLATAGEGGLAAGCPDWGDALADCIAWPANRPVLVIAGTRTLDPLGWALLPKPNDGKVNVAATRLPGAAHQVIPATHTFIMRHPDAIVTTVELLLGIAMTHRQDNASCRVNDGIYIARASLDEPSLSRCDLTY